MSCEKKIFVETRVRRRFVRAARSNAHAENENAGSEKMSYMYVAGRGLVLRVGLKQVSIKTAFDAT